MNGIADHLWQSTVFAGVVWLLTLALRKNHARVRHDLWLAASIKFLIPFSMFVALGSQVHWRTAPSTAPANITIVMDQVSQPFTAPAVIATVPPAPSLLPSFLLAVWACGFIGITCAWWVRWRRILAAVRAGSPVQLDLPIRAMSSPTLLEPGVFGIFRPILLLPEGIFDRLTPAQLQAVIAHELCHVRHRDNFIATIHMFVETVFWFHPLVWWIGKRMVEERERACDEEVLREFGEPKAYAEGILNVCKLYVESPLACVSGVTGSDLGRRIEAIMMNRRALKLDRARKVLLACAGIAVFAVPLVIGLGNAPPIRGQSSDAASPRFEVASIKVSKDPAPGGNIDVTPGRFRGKDLALQWLILVAYRIKSDNLSGVLPSWTLSERYDIDAKTEDASGEDRILLALQTLLVDRFKLRLHREMKEQPVYFLTIGKTGIKMPTGSCLPVKKDFPNECWSQGGDGLIHTLDWRGVSMSDPAGIAYRSLAAQLSSIVKRPVIDKTGLTRTFDVHLRWARDPEPTGIRPPDDSAVPTPSAEPAGPSIFDAVQEQLGLKLESGRGPVEYLIVDHVEKPTAN
jgi:bla regulator protein blaR1